MMSFPLFAKWRVFALFNDSIFRYLLNGGFLLFVE
jgi:hypothetical protein